MGVIEYGSILLLAMAITACSTDKKESGHRSGKVIYESFCNACHGADGAKGVGGAKDLSTSVASRKVKVKTVKDGRGGMAGYGTLLSTAEINNVVDYIEGLKK